MVIHKQSAVHSPSHGAFIETIGDNPMTSAR